MTIKLLVVDDSGFFQKRIAEILKPDPNIKIVGFASNGQEAIDKVQSLSPDVITLDYEMPVMDGLTALRNIMKLKPTPVLMFSSLTYDGARVTLDALAAGAVDFLPKNFEDLQRGGGKIRQILTDKIKSVATQYNRKAGQNAIAEGEKPITAKSPTAAGEKKPVVSGTTGVIAKGKLKRPVDVVVIGTSTGGPVALQKILTELPSSFPKPIILVQHMPATFTSAFAERLNNLCAINVQLAVDGDQMKPGVAYLAPGGQQLMFDRGKLKVIDGDDRLNYKPSVDIAFASAAKYFPGKTLAIVLTGMGSDGKEGARLLKETGATIWTQDEDTSVIYGMPMAIVKASLSDAVLPLQNIALKMVNEVK